MPWTSGAMDLALDDQRVDDAAEVVSAAVYDESGQLETGSFMDYCMPRADNFLPFKLETNTSLCTHNPLGAKGCGEAGTIGAPAAIMNAVVDALAPLGTVDIDMPATSERVWRP